MALPHPDWVRATVTVSGEPGRLEAFRQAAAGSGVVPWDMDFDRLEEDWFLLMMRPPPQRRTISTAGAHILARQLRDAVWTAHQDAMSKVGVSRACPFDLHQMIPVPGPILRLGERHPRALAWMWENWGTTWPLRRVEPLPCPHGFRVQFWSADWTPWQAIVTLRQRWAGLEFNVAP